tara:strand:+ start:6611 stop:7609 length:999 start_codon:yes stop_codon:yes gene_type:complete
MKIAIFAAGTGGHIYPALSIAKEFGKENVIFIASNRELEKKIYRDSGFEVKHLNVSGFRGKSLLEKLTWPINLILGIFSTIFLLIKFKPSSILLMGNYVSVVGLISSILLFKPIYIHEQNSILGSANKLSLPFAKKVFSTFKLNIKKEFNHGQPVRPDFNNFDSGLIEKEHILVLGGSQGASFFNKNLPNIFEKLTLKTKVIFQTGNNNNFISNKNIKYLEFIKNMPEVMSKAKFIICRAGASTVAEVQSLGLPAIFIPLPDSIDNHQLKNAEIACQDGGGIILNEKEFDEDNFLKIIREFDGLNHQDLSKKMRKSIHLESARKIANEIKQH